MKKQSKIGIGMLVGALLASGCMDMGSGDEADDLDEAGEIDEETSTVEQGAWSAWYDLSGASGTGVVRACKTSTRVNWEFAFNSYTTSLTGGDGISQISSSIAGQSSGSKYRTRGSSTTFSIALGTNGVFRGVVYTIALLPNC